MELMTGRNTRINNILSMKRILILISLCTVFFNGCELLLPQGHRFLPIYNNSESTLLLLGLLDVISSIIIMIMKRDTR